MLERRSRRNALEARNANQRVDAADAHTSGRPKFKPVPKSFGWPQGFLN